jgi:gliding motility-associated-like protein
MGLQGGIYSSCGGAVMDVQCSCTVNPFTLFSASFVVGQIYYFVLDGCGGNVCNYEINVLSGSTVPAPPNNPGPINGNVTVCPGSTPYNIAPPTGATIYNWTVTPSSMGTITGTGPNINVNWGATPGTAQLCVTVANQCESNPTPSCTTVTITQPPTATISGSGVLCGPGSPPAALTITFTGTGPWTFTIIRNGSPQPPPITTSDNPFTLNVTQTGTYSLQNVSYGGTCPGTVSGSAIVTQFNLTATATPVAATCGLSNGGVNLSVTPAGTYTYNWSSGQSTQNLTNIPAGPYSVTVTAPNGCTRVVDVNVNDNPINFTVTPTITANTTCTGGNGSISLAVTPAGTYTYQWEGGQTTSSLTNVPAGNYSVTVSAGGTCTVAGNYTINDNPNEPTITNTTTASTCELSNGSINISVSGGVSPYTFNWSNGTTTEDLSNIPAGAYSVTVTGANGCTEVADINLNNNNPPINVSNNVVANTTCNGGNGSITINVTPPGTYTYTWSSGQTTPNISNLPAGSYTVTVSAGGACTAEATVAVPDNPNLPNINPQTVASTCDLNNGSASVSVNGGVAPYTYAWSNGATTPNLTNIPADNYTVTVTGANGCTAEANLTVNNNNPPINVNANITNNTTCTGGNGGIVLTVSPAGTYTYTWSSGQTTASINNVPAGSYSVTISAGGSCTAEGNFDIPDNPNEPSVSPNPTNASCGLNNGTASVFVSGGIAPYTYNWSNGASTTSLTNVPEGSYSVTVTGANGCTAETTVTVAENPIDLQVNFNVVPNTTCAATGNGSINITVIPFGTYTYTWSNNATGTSLTNLQPGSYTVTVSAGGTCTTVASFEVEDLPNEPSVSTNANPANCGLSNGSASATVFGGVAPYTYSWSNGASVPNLNNIPGGNYTVTVTASNGCTATESVTVDNDEISIDLSGSSENNTSCLSVGNGSIDLDVSVGGNYTLTWSNGFPFEDQTNLSPGTYTVTVNAGGSCTQTASFTIANDAETPILSTAITPSVCLGFNGAVDLNISGGIEPYSIFWNLGSSEEDLYDILGGNYSVTVTSATGCVASASVTVPNNNLTFSVTGASTNSTSCVSNNGAINITITPPNPEYVIAWSNNSTNEDLTNLAPGAYSVTVSVGASCIQTANFTVANATTPPNLSTATTAATCGLTNGGVNLTATGSAPFTYNWSNSAASEDLSNVVPGSYSVTVTDAAGCSSTAQATVANNSTNIDLSGTPAANTLCGATANGSVSTIVSPAGNYTYAWSNGAATPNISNVAPGTYTVTVTSGTCSSTQSFTVANNAAAPDLTSAATPSSCGLTNGSASVTASGGVSPFTYSWSGNGGSAANIANVAAGAYTVTVSGANGCSATASVNIANNDPVINITGTPNSNVSCVSPNGSVNVTVSPAGTYTYIWSNSANSEDIANLNEGSYTVTVSAGGSCTSSSTFQVANNTSDPVIAENVTAAICNQSNGGIDLTVTGATTPYLYTWSNSAASEDLTGVLPGNYSVTVTGANGCSATATLNVPNNSNTFSLAGTASPDNNCTLNNGGVDLTITPNGTYTYLWSNSAATQDLVNLAPGTYTVTVSDGGACTASASYIVDDETSYPNVSDLVTAELCGLSNGGVDLTVSGGLAPYTYAWSNNAVSQDLTNVPSGAYSVTVTGANNCFVTADATIPDNTISFTINGAPVTNTSCAPSNGGINLSVTPAGTYTYQWSNSAVSEDLTAISGGTYSVTVSAGGTCTNTASFTVGDNTLAPVIAEDVTAALCAAANGSIDLTITGGAAPYTFEWSNSQSSEDVSNLAAGNYAVTVSGSNGCETTDAFVVPDDIFSPAITGTPSPNTTCGTNNGAVAINVSPAGTYTYQWSNNTSNQNLTAVGAGSYSVTVSAGGGCTAVASFNVQTTTDDPSLSPSVTPALCGLDNGAINLSVSGATTPYVYQWSNLAATEDLDDVLPGNYAVTVTGANGCSSTTSVNVPDNSVTFSINGTPNANTACANGNGSVDVTISPATPATGLPYTFVWSNSAVSQNIANLTSGQYTVTVSAGGSCTAEAGFNVGNNPDEPAIVEAVTPSICGAPDGAIDLTVTGGTLPYVFNWSNNTSSEDLTAILAGNYEVTVTAANGCSATGVYNVPNFSNTFSFSGLPTANTLCVNGNGGIDLTLTPPSLPFVFTWSNSASTEDLSDLVPGSYSVTINDGSGCQANATYIIEDNSPTVVVAGSIEDIKCFGQNTGAISLNINGGNAPYVFNWSPAIPGNPQTPQSLSTGTYDVTVTDGAGCEGTASFTIGAPTSAVSVNCSQSSSVSIPGASDGVGSVVISGGTAPYFVDWTPGGQQGNVAAGNFNINSLSEGVYDVSVTDANGCPATCDFEINAIQCETELGTMSSSLQALCGNGCITATYDDLGQFLEPGDALQFILHTGTGNQIVNEIARNDEPTFCFDPSKMTYGVTYYISAAAGNNDGSGNVVLGDLCTVVTAGTPIVFKADPQAAIAQPGNINCLVPQVPLQGSSTVPGSTYQWIASNGGVISGNPSQPSVTATAGGDYTLIVSLNGCADTTAVSVSANTTQPSVTAAASPSEFLDCVVTEITLTGLVTGTSSAGFAWWFNGSQVSNLPSFQVNQSGDYTLVLTELNSLCTDTATITIGLNEIYPQLFLDPAPVITCKDSIVTLSGGSPATGILFQWAIINGTDTTILADGSTIPVGTPGTYYLIGIDNKNGCTNAIAQTVSGDLAEPNADAGEPFTMSCFGGGINSLDGTGSAGAGAVTYEWTTANGNILSGANTTQPSIDMPGTYELTVTNAGNGCSDTDVVVILSDGPTAELLVTQPACEGDGGVIRVMQVNGGTPPMQFSIDGGQTFSAQNVFLDLPPGVYNFIVQDDNGCQDEATEAIQQPQLLEIQVDPQAAIVLGDSYQITTDVSIPVGEIASISWNPPTYLDCDTCLNPVATPTNTILYRVTVVSQSGCEAEAPLLLQVDKERGIYVPNVFSPNGDNLNDILLIFADPDKVANIKQFLVFDRWGETLWEYFNFHPSDPVHGWDGKHRGEYLNPQVCVWFAEVEFTDGVVEFFEGDVTILR